MYYSRPEENIALRAIQSRKNLSIVVLEGAPGTGKTAWTQYVAEQLSAEYLYTLLHHWTSDEDLFVGVHVGRVAAGVSNPSDAYELGILARAAVASQTGKVVVCLDEIDKAPQRAEALLLDFLQHGRVFGPTRECWQASLSNLVVCLTTNGTRPLMEATLRRAYRVRMAFLPAHVEADLIRKATGAKMGLINAVIGMMGIVRADGVSAPSLQEGLNLVRDIIAVAQSAADCDLLIAGYLVKEDEDAEAIKNKIKQPGAVLWGEVKR